MRGGREGGRAERHPLKECVGEGGQGGVKAREEREEG